MPKVVTVERLFPLFFLLLPGHGKISAQTPFWQTREACLAQTPPSDTPQIFAPGQLVSDSGIALDRVAFSADGKEFYYCYADHWFNSAGAKVKYFKYSGGRWQGPLVLNEGLYGPSFSKDDRELYFLGEKGEIWRSQRKEGGNWTPPSIYLRANYGLYDLMPVNSGLFYVASNYGRGAIQDWSSYDFSVLHISGKDTSLISLGRPLNTAGFDGDFYISPDESFMIISTKESKDFECELDISFRRRDGAWTSPKSLGPLVNDGVAHRWGQYVTPNGKYLFYTRGTGEKDCHIYWVRFDTMLEHLRHSNFPPYVKTPLPDRVVTRNKAFRWTAGAGSFEDDDGISALTFSAALEGGQPLPAWITFDPGTATFSGTAPGMATYRIIVTATDPSGANAQSTFMLQVRP